MRENLGEAKDSLQLAPTGAHIPFRQDAYALQYSECSTGERQGLIEGKAVREGRPADFLESL